MLFSELLCQIFYSILCDWELKIITNWDDGALLWNKEQRGRTRFVRADGAFGFRHVDFEVSLGPPTNKWKCLKIQREGKSEGEWGGWRAGLGI